MNIVYVGEIPIVGKVRAVEIATALARVEGKPAYVLLPPLAVVYDVVTFPVLLLVALSHAG